MLTRFVNPGSSGGNGTTNALSGANAAYASLSAAEAALEGDYTAESPTSLDFYGGSGGGGFTVSCALRIVCDMGNPRVVDTTTARFGTATWVLDATHKVVIQAADGTSIAGQATTDSRHKGVANAGYKVAGTTNSLGSITAEFGHMVFLDLEAEGTSGTSRRGWSTTTPASGQIWIVNAIGSAAAGGSSRYGLFYANNTVVVNGLFSSGGDAPIVNNGSTASSFLYNCGAIGTAGTVGISANTSEPTVINTWSVHGTLAFDADIVTGALNNASNDSSAPTGGTEQTGIVTTAATDFVNYGSGDYKPYLNGKLEGNGTSLAADGTFPFAFDIAGVARSQWDIGPFAYVAAPSGGFLNRNLWWDNL
jgi:hypothetical protein